MQPPTPTNTNTGTAMKTATASHSPASLLAQAAPADDVPSLQGAHRLVATKHHSKMANTRFCSSADCDDRINVPSK